jgi:hypothetical protein
VPAVSKSVPAKPANEPALPRHYFADLKNATDVAAASTLAADAIAEAIDLFKLRGPDVTARRLTQGVFALAALARQWSCIDDVSPELSAHGPYHGAGFTVAANAHVFARERARYAGRLVWYRNASPRFDRWPVEPDALEADIKADLPNSALLRGCIPPRMYLLVDLEVEAAKTARDRRLAGAAVQYQLPAPVSRHILADLVRAMRQIGLSMDEIAKKLGRNRTSLYRELKAAADVGGDTERREPPRGFRTAGGGLEAIARG